ncbi:NACHT domain-containing protein [Nocardioides plantarum]|uniref:NACHT domain-containing protein n=1 Tax=Nocardioides plantarum TaxID=29299 RepID=A0ABV5KAJ5_9ACTN|nr:NACHT domain-containing protein [Nocardioides plantarum]
MSTGLALGTMVAKWIFGAWLKDTVFADPAADLLDLVRDSVLDGAEGRRTSRQFEEVAEIVAERLEPFIEQEFRGADQGERAAAAQAVVTTLERSFVNHRLDVVELDLDATTLESGLRRWHPTAAADERLGSAGTALYDLLLTECCHYIVAITSQLPEFASLAARQLLTRSTRLIDLTTEVLERLPRTMPESWGGGSADDVFSSKYLKDVVQKHDHLQLFGVKDQSIRSSYSLSVAYISLTATAPTTNAKGIGRDTFRSRTPEQPDDDATMKPPGDVANDTLRVEAALNGQSKIVLGGTAGSGKTTLLQWVAVTASQAGFSGELASWNGSIPFLLPLRRYANGDLPAPEEFLGVHHKSLAGVMPSGWVHRVLAAGHAVVLIDGLDELPETQREDAKQWLLDLIGNFPQARFIVTARPLAISGGWEDIDDFGYTELLPMQRSDVRAFVTHWHEATAQGAKDDDERLAIAAAREQLLQSLGEADAIRMLCTSPLLCALVCAMHRQNVGKLPQNRMELYETALLMLVSKRDEERRIDSSIGEGLTYQEKRALLADFALWLHESGLADAEEALLGTRVRRKITSLPHSSSRNPRDITTNLLTRSEVLRTPVEGRVDFVHRTFLEYLAAFQLIEDDAIDKVINQAHMGDWREVVIMCAGHASAARRYELLEGLIRRGQNEIEHRHSLYLLAVACLETSPVLKPELQEAINECLDKVVPPLNMTDATAVASAGALAVPRLARSRQMLATTAAACVRALSLIGSEEALQQLKTYSSDNRVTVARQLIRAWGQFDPEKYAREVLASSPLDYGAITVSSTEALDNVHYLQKARQIRVDLPGGVGDLSKIASSDRVSYLNFCRARSLRDFRELHKFPRLLVCYVEDTNTLESTDGISACTDLQLAWLDHNPNLVDISDLSTLHHLKSVHLRGTGVTHLNDLSGMSLTELRIGGRSLQNLPDDIAANQLSISHAPRIQDFSSIGSSTALQTLGIYVGADAASVEVHVPPSVTELTLSGPADRFQVVSGGVGVVSIDLPAETMNRIGPMPQLVEIEFPMLSTTDLSSVLDIDRFDSDEFPSLERIEFWGRATEELKIPGFTLSMTTGRPVHRSIYVRD